MGAAMNGLRPIAELMFSDFFAVCWDMVANQIAKTRYMTNGQVELPIVIRTANGGGARFGAQHSQSVETWMMAIPGLKVVVPSTPLDMIGLFAAAVRDPDPVVVVEPKVLYASKGEVPDGEIVDRLGVARTVREGDDVTICALGAMVPKALEAAGRLGDEGVAADVIDVRSLVPLDVRTIVDSVDRTGHLVTVEENPRLAGWGAEIASIVADEAFFALDGPIVRVTTPHLPLPSADVLEDAAIPSVDRIVEGVRRAVA
jgi:acetoin:2,6-dichlorophenolindophenol oxidoreductase subunit beta